MARLRLASYNIEWMNALFDDAGRVLADEGPSGRYGVSRAAQIAALGRVLPALDADGLMIIEAPDQGSRRSSPRALEGLAAHLGLRARKALIGFASETEQEIAFLYDPDRLAAWHDPMGQPAPSAGATGAPRFDTTRRADLDEDGAAELVRLSKPPLEVALRFGRHDLRLIGVHAKSKSPHGAKDASDAVRIGIENRRKQLAECGWIRARVEDHLAAGDRVIVLGDLNDGPGLDEYERLFGQSGVEVIMGLDGPPERRLHDPHALIAGSQGVTSARFFVPSLGGVLEALLDFVLVSPQLVAGAQWRIWHPLQDKALAQKPELADALLAASDHFPVTCDLQLAD